MKAKIKKVRIKTVIMAGELRLLNRQVGEKIFDFHKLIVFIYDFDKLIC